MKAELESAIKSKVIRRTVPDQWIHPASRWASLELKQLWEYRELVYFLTWRDIKVRYKQTALGVVWAIIQPLFLMTVFSIFFGHLVRIPSEGIPYPLFAFSGLLLWQLFAHALNESSNSLVANERLITKVYFPRLVIPISATLVGLVDFAVALIVLLGMMTYYRISPGGWSLLMLPIFILLAIITALGVGLWLSALNVQYRDVRYTIAFVIQLWFFLTPITYPSSIVPASWRLLYGLNPMASVIEGFRWALLGQAAPSPELLAVSITAVFLILLGGIYYFRHMEGGFADLV